MEDKLQLLESKCLEQIRLKEKELSDLRSKLNFIKELKAESNHLNAFAASARYRTMTLTDAVLDAVNVLTSVGTGVNAASVAAYLLSNGFQPKGKNHQISVSIALSRLSSGYRKRIDSEKVGGSRFYKSKKISGTGAEAGQPIKP